MADGRAVCWRCFADEALQDHVQANAESNRCDFCGRRARSPFAARLDDVVGYIDERIREHFDDPANGLGYESAEGGYQGDQRQPFARGLCGIEPKQAIEIGAPAPELRPWTDSCLYSNE